MEQGREREARNFQSVRVILEGLILVGIVWLGSSVQESKMATVQMQTQIANLSAQLAGVPDLSRQVAQMQVTQSEHDRRIQALEGRR